MTQAANGKSFWKGLAGGFTGGAVSYAGKVVIASEFTGAGILGRQIDAVGASIVANASRNQDLLGFIVLPIGPVRLQLGSQAPAGSRIKLDLTSALTAAYISAQPETRLDWGRTLSSGAPVFIQGGDHIWAGRHSSGVIILRNQEVPTDQREELMAFVLRHELVHLAQYDFSAIVWGDPAERWILNQIPYGRVVHQYVAFRLDHAGWAVIRELRGGEIRMFESEARNITSN